MESKILLLQNKITQSVENNPSYDKRKIQSLFHQIQALNKKVERMENRISEILSYADPRL
jgi:hypothetical protein